MQIPIAIAEDNATFRRSVVNLIRSESKDILVSIEAVDGVDLLQKLAVVNADIVLMDIRMPVMDGFEATLRIRDLYPSVKIIAFTQYDLENNIIEMSKLGVKSFIGKSQMANELIRGIKIVHSGGIYYPDEIGKILHNYLLRTLRDSHSTAAPIDKEDWIIMKMVCNGKSSSEIGELMHKSPRTIEEHRSNLYKKLNVRSKEELIILAAKSGWI